MAPTVARTTPPHPATTPSGSGMAGVRCCRICDPRDGSTVETGNWKLETKSNWELETGNWKLETVRHLQAAATSPIKSPTAGRTRGGSQTPRPGIRDLVPAHLRAPFSQASTGQFPVSSLQLLSVSSFQFPVSSV
jgi:hypothetical protein